MTGAERRARADPDDPQAAFTAAQARARAGLGPPVFPGLSFSSTAFAIVDVTEACGRRERIGATPGMVKIPPHQSWQLTVPERDPEAQSRALKALVGQELDGLILEHPLGEEGFAALLDLRPRALWINIEDLPESSLRGLAGSFPGLQRLVLDGPAPACALERGAGKNPRFIELTHAYEESHLSALKRWDGLRGLKLDRGHSPLGLRPRDLARWIDVGDLEELGLSSGQGLDGFETFSSLKALRLSVPRFSPAELAAMPMGLQSLEVIKYQGLNLEDCRAIAARSEMRSLSLRDQRELGVAESELLSGLERLDSLDLSLSYERFPPNRTRLSNKALRAFSVGRHLAVSGHAAAGASGVARPGELRQLGARDTGFGSMSLAAFGRLEELVFDSRREASSVDAVRSLVGLSRLRRLALDARELPPVALRVLRGCPELRSLSVRLPHDSSRHLQTLVQAAPGLEQLEIEGGELGSLPHLDRFPGLFQLRLASLEERPPETPARIKLFADSFGGPALKPTDKLS